MTKTDDGLMTARRKLILKHISLKKVFVQTDKRSHCRSHTEHNNWILSMKTKQIIYITQFTKVLFYALGLVLKNYGYPGQ